MLTYEWVTGARFNVEAQAIGERCERLRKKNGGRVTPQLIVSDGKSKASPLHPCFEWDEARAAEQFRLTQARSVLRSLVVVVDERMPIPVRAFLSVRVELDDEDDDASGDRMAYTSVLDAMSDPLLREQVLNSALRELRSWRSKYHRLNELARLFSAIDEQLEIGQV